MSWAAAQLSFVRLNKSEKKMFKTQFRLFIFSLAAAFFLSFSAQAAFIEGLEDVPLLKGMVQVQKDNISFGNEESRLVEAYLTSSKMGFAKVEKFYTETLPQLGWTYQGKRDDTLSFYRDGEVLDIAKESVKPLMVRITVKSKL